MALLSVFVVLACIGAACFGISKIPWIAPPYKTAIYWFAGICTGIWLLSITGVLGHINDVPVPHV